MKKKKCLKVKHLLTKRDLTPKKIEKTLGSDLSDQVKNQLKSTDQIKTRPIKNLNNQNIKTKLRLQASRFNRSVEY